MSIRSKACLALRCECSSRKLAYIFSTGCRYFFKVAGNLFESRKSVSPTLLRRSRTKKDPQGVFFLTARAKGLEPSTFRVHVVHYFHSGVDYIFTISFDLGTPVSSLYGAPILCVFVYGVPSVFAYLATLIGRCFKRLSLHRYPGKFQSPFRKESCMSTGGRSNQLSYARSY